MSGTIFLAGILQFQSKALFEEALDALRTEETYSESHTLVPIFKDAMISDSLMVVRHTSPHSDKFYDRLMAEAYLLSEFAGRGYIAGILKDAHPKVQVAMAAMTHPVIDPFQQQPDPEPASDYFPRLTNTQLSYHYHSEGRSETVTWMARSRRFGPYQYIFFPALGSEDPFNDWWDGHYYLKSGSKWYSVATDLDAQALSDPAVEEIQLILDGMAQPGTTYFSYVPGTESFRLYTHEGFEDIETPVGEFRRAMKVRVDLYFLPTDEARYTADDVDRAFKKVTTTHYFGKGAGLVKLVFDEGELILATMDVVDAPVVAENSAASVQETASDARPNPDGKNRPWWKFW